MAYDSLNSVKTPTEIGTGPQRSSPVETDENLLELPESVPRAASPELQGAPHQRARYHPLTSLPVVTIKRRCHAQPRPRADRRQQASRAGGALVAALPGGGSARALDDTMSDKYLRMFEVLKSGSVDDLEAEVLRDPEFPSGADCYIGSRWIINAIDSGSMLCIKWMLQKGVDLNFRDEGGYTPLHSAIERSADDRNEVLKLLLQAGAPVNLKGINDWTPAHMAAARDDVDALRILVQHGADLSIRTEIDDYATPLEEARNLRKMNAMRYLESVV